MRLALVMWNGHSFQQAIDRRGLAAAGEVGQRHDTDQIFFTVDHRPAAPLQISHVAGDIVDFLSRVAVPRR